MNLANIKAKVLAFWGIVMKVFIFLQQLIFLPTVKTLKKNKQLLRPILFFLSLLVLLQVIWLVVVNMFPAIYFTPNAPGSTVMILSGKSVLVNGYVCQQWTRAKITPTSPEGEQRWYKFDRIWFPIDYYVSVIDSYTGEVKWVPSEILRAYSAFDSKSSTCHNAINDPDN